DPDVKDGDGRPPLFWAIEKGSEEVVRRMLELLLDRGADINSQDASGKTILDLAAAAGDVELAELALEHGIMLEATAKDGMTALHRAVLHQHDIIMDMLLDAGADAEAQDGNGDTPLHFA
ncbi:ankyrin, partial [Aspergillus costaricaensis CBS 115574]